MRRYVLLARSRTGCRGRHALVAGRIAIRTPRGTNLTQPIPWNDALDGHCHRAEIMS